MGVPAVVNPRDQLTDEPVAASVHGCRGGQRVRVTATSMDAGGVAHTAWAEYEAAADGTIDLARQAPLAGSYRGSDPYGLWWSMRPAGDGPFAGALEPIPTEITVHADGGAPAVARFVRHRVAPGLTVEDFRESGLVATLFVPADKPAPAAIVLGGSEGGTAQTQQVAGLLASRGIAALALAYFGAEGLPDRLSGVPVEYVETAVASLAARPEVAGPKVGIVGSSRGAELALLVAAGCPSVGAVAAFAPSGVVWPGLASGATGAAAWTRGGRPLPYAVPLDEADDARLHPGAPREAYLRALDRRDAVAPAVIPIERIAGPVLLVSGDDDQLWPSDVFAEQALLRLRHARRPHADRHDRHAGAGHIAARPPGLPAARTAVVHPLDGQVHALGGTRRANARAAATAWPRTVEFLRSALATA